MVEEVKTENLNTEAEAENLDSGDNAFVQDDSISFEDDSTLRQMFEELMASEDVEESEDEEEIEEEPKKKELAEEAEDLKKEEKVEKVEKDEKSSVENNQIEKIKSLLKGEILKSKGLEVKVEDFTPEELKALLQKGLRFYQAMEENARKEAELAAKEKSLGDALKQLEKYQGKLSEAQKEQLAEQAKKIPDELLEITSFDDESTVALKNYLKELKKQVDELSRFQQEKQAAEQQQALLREIEEYRNDYPLANVEEVLAVHFLSGGQVPIKEIMRASQVYYGSVDFVKRIFASNPEVRQAIADEIIKDYLVKKEKAKKSPATKKVSGETGKSLLKEESVDSAKLDFDKASDLAKKILKEFSGV